MEEQPKLIGKNISLRKYELSDVMEDWKIGNDINVSKWIEEIPFPYTLNDSRKWIEKTLETKTDYFYAVISNRDDCLVGTTWINNIHNNEGELSYLIRSKYWGRGYGSEAAKLMVDFAFNNLNLNTIYSKVNEINRGSIKILQNLGFKHFKTLEKYAKVKFDDRLYNELHLILKK